MKKIVEEAGTSFPKKTPTTKCALTSLENGNFLFTFSVIIVDPIEFKKELIQKHGCSCIFCIETIAKQNQ